MIHPRPVVLDASFAASLRIVFELRIVAGPPSVLSRSAPEKVAPRIDGPHCQYSSRP
jgi:hypothetical protein